MNWRRSFAVALFCALAMGQAAAAQTSNDGWRTAVYPVLGWVPLGIEINVDVPPHDGGDGGGGDIVDGRFDGAFLGGFSTTNGKLWVEGDVIWAGVGGDVDRPAISVDADIIYGRGSVGFAVAPNWFVTGGVRRLALKYDVDIAGQARFERKPGIWDPLVGVAWHRGGDTLDLHAVVEGGGFGAGADVDFGATFRFDWKPVRHFGIAAGYNFLYFKVSDTVRDDREFVVKQTLHGPVLGIGFYF